MTWANEIQVQNLNHLGLIAGIIDEIGLVEIINDLAGIQPQEKINAGLVVKGIILNGLGFVSRPLYLFPQFFEDKATEHLLGKGIEPQHLNDDRIGRVMDKLYKLGLSSTFLSVSLAAVEKYGISTEFAHLDSSSISLHGQYNYQESNLETIISRAQTPNPEVLEVPIKITQGYSRDHRPELKQFIIDLIVSGDGDVPFSLKVADGNQSDKAVFGQIASEFKKPLNFEGVIVSDSALYSEKNLNIIKQMFWLCRVPLSLATAKKLVTEVKGEELIESELSGYSYLEVSSNYGKIPQRQLRQQLKQCKTGIKNQLGKFTERPTLRWIFQCFQGIHVVLMAGVKQIVNLSNERLLTLSFFPDACQKYYLESG